MVNKIKKQLQPHVGKKLQIGLKQIRKAEKYKYRNAVLLSLSRHVFVLNIIHSAYCERVAFSYSDVISGEIKIGGVDIVFKKDCFA